MQADFLQAIVEALPLAIGVLVSSLPLTVVPVILLTRQDRNALVGFLGGWCAGFLLIGSLVLLAADWISPDPQGPPAWISWTKILLGGLLLGLAFKQWRGRPRAGEPAALPGWLNSFDTMSSGRAALFGMLLAALNPKYTVLVASGAITIAGATPMPAAQFGALVVFLLISSLGLFVPWLVSVWMGERAVPLLQGFKAWMVRHNNVILALALGLLGLWVLGNGLSEL